MTRRAGTGSIHYVTDQARQQYRPSLKQVRSDDPATPVASEPEAPIDEAAEIRRRERQRRKRQRQKREREKREREEQERQEQRRQKRRRRDRERRKQQREEQQRKEQQTTEPPRYTTTLTNEPANPPTKLTYKMVHAILDRTPGWPDLKQADRERLVQDRWEEECKNQGVNLVDHPVPGRTALRNAIEDAVRRRSR